MSVTIHHYPRFPRIAVNIEKQIRCQLEERAASNRHYQGMANANATQQVHSIKGSGIATLSTFVDYGGLVHFNSLTYWASILRPRSLMETLLALYFSK